MPREKQTQPNQAEHAKQLRDRGKYDEAIAEYDNLIADLERQSERDAHTTIAILRFRVKKGHCLCDDRRLQKADISAKAEAYVEAEAYVRETLRRWKDVGKEGRKAAADTSIELALCLIRQLNLGEELGEDIDAARGEETVVLLQEALSYYEGATGDERMDDRRMISLLGHLSDILFRLQRYEEAEEFNRRGIKKVQELPTDDRLRKRDAALKDRLADALFYQAKYSEAIAEYQDILRLWDSGRGYSEELLLHTPDTYQQYISECARSLVLKRWQGLIYYALGKARDEISKRKRLQQQWQRAIVSVRFIVRIKILVNKHQVARRVEAERRWRIVLVPVVLVARVTIMLRKRRIRKRWRKVLSYLSKMARANLVLKHHQARKVEAGRRWQKAIVYATQSAKVRIVIRRLRIWKRWDMVLLHARQQARVALEFRTKQIEAWHVTIFKARVRRKWYLAIVCARAVVRVTAILRAVRCQKRWDMVLLHARQQARVALEFRTKQIKAWHATIFKARVRRKWYPAIVCARAVVRVTAILRAVRCQRRWRKAFIAARLVVIAEKQRLAGVETQLQARSRWFVAYRKIRFITSVPRKDLTSYISNVPLPFLERLDTPYSTPMLRPQLPPIETIGLARSRDDSLVLDDLSPIKISQSGVFFSAELSKRDEAAQKWLAPYTNFCGHLARNSRSQSKDFPVKVAIFDTGIDAINPYIKLKWPPINKTAYMSEEEKDVLRKDGMKKYYKDFLDSPSTPDDKDGHGTHIAGIILRYAPNARLYVGRIAETRAKCKTDGQFNSRVANAIKCAIETWEVNIISISFGLRETAASVIDELISKAHAKDIVIFAAACNEGGRSSVSYPANHHLVFSIRALDGDGAYQKFNPYPTEANHNFSILGTNILSTWPTLLGAPETSTDTQGPKERSIGKEKCMTNYMAGTSFATPLAAALIANVFAYYREHKSQIFSDFVQRDQYRLECFKGVRKVLRAMSEKVGEFRAISPWKEGNNFSNYADGDGDLNYSLKNALKNIGS